MNFLVLVASGASAFALVVHVMLGRRRPFPPPAGLDKTAHALHADAWFGRHLPTVVLAVMAVGYSNAAQRADAADLVVALSSLGCGLVALRLMLAIRHRMPYLGVEDWGFVAVAAGLGLAGGLLPAPPVMP
jgi:hypothetical protein